MWVLDLKGNARTSGERRQREAGNVFDDKIRVGVAVYFLVRRKGADGFRIFYHAIDDFMRSHPKVDYVKNASLTRLDFDEIRPDVAGNWFNQSNSNFEHLLLLADRQTKSAHSVAEERAVFKLNALGVNTARDEWVYDFVARNLRNKVHFFVDTYNDLLDRGGEPNDLSIKWSEATRNHFRRGRRITYNEQWLVQSLYRPFVVRQYFSEVVMSDRLTSNHYEIFGSDLKHSNKVICFSGIASSKPFQVLATDRLFGFDTLEKTQCLSLYRYTPQGERVSNITDWAIQRLNDHYRAEWGDDYARIAGDDGITAEDIFAYTYAVLHDPEYREKYAVDLLREFPRLPLYHDFDAWNRMGRELLDLHLGFESAEPYSLERVETNMDKQNGQDSVSPKVMLRPDKERGAIVLDAKTMLTGVPESAWRYHLGNRSALEWILDQYKERKPKDPTIRERFNTYRFTDHKERVIDLLQRVCTVSVETVRIVDQLNLLSDIDQI